MDGMQLSSNSDSESPGLLVDGGRVWLDRSRIVQNTGGGIVAQHGADLRLQNCFVGGSVNNVPAVVVDAATVRVAYTTVIGGLGMTPVALSCTLGSAASVTDSIVLLQSDSDPIDCDDATFEHSASEVFLPGTGNTLVDSFNDASTWFTNVGTGDFSLTNDGGAIFRDIAQWNTGDPPTDINGDARPVIDLTADYGGADILP
jgi:hypothetical protein